MNQAAAPPVVYKIPQSVLVVIYTSALEVLLLERADRPGFWQSVTGSRDSKQERLDQTAVREVREETGIVIERRSPPEPDLPAAVPLSHLVDWRREIEYEIYPQWRHRYAPGVTHNIEHWFGVCVPRDIPIVLAPREHLRYRWVDWEEAAQSCFSPSNREAILGLPLRIEEHA